MEKDILNYSPTVMFRGTPCISGNIVSTKNADHILEMPWRGVFVIIISIMLLLKLSWRINAANNIKKKRRSSSRLATVMFSGTPCLFKDQIFLTFLFLKKLNLHINFKIGLMKCFILSLVNHVIIWSRLFSPLQFTQQITTEKTKRWVNVVFIYKYYILRYKVSSFKIWQRESAGNQ